MARLLAVEPRGLDPCTGRGRRAAPAVRIDLDGRLDTAVSLVVDDGRVARIYAVRNPQTLARLGELATVSR